MKDDNRSYRLRRKMQVAALNFTSKEFVSKIYFKLLLNYPLDLKNPKTFNEKMQWYKLYYCPNNPEIVQCSDKYAVRNYLDKKGYGFYLNDLLYVWETPEEIVWDELPDQFVIKCNHGCQYNIICSSKAELNRTETINKLRQWLKENFGDFNAEPHYNLIPKKIICEKFLGGNIIDYKFYCFNGEPKFMYMAIGFGNGNNERIQFFNIDGTKAPFCRTDYPEMEQAVVPNNFEEMIKLAESISKGFPFVRVDLFSVSEKIYFSELTFTPCGGLMKISPKEYDYKLGQLFDLAHLKKDTVYR